MGLGQADVAADIICTTISAGTKVIHALKLTIDRDNIFFGQIYFHMLNLHNLFVMSFATKPTTTHTHISTDDISIV